MLLKDKRFKYAVLVVVLLIGSYYLYNLMASADEYNNKLAIGYVSMDKIDTGTESWSNDGLDYNSEVGYKKITGYTAGNDSNADNRLVRSFDTITYHFSVSLQGKNNYADAYNRTVTVDVELPDEIKDYVACERNVKAGQKNCKKEIKNVNVDTAGRGGTTSGSITLYVLGAPNGTLISPKFTIQESTNTDSDYKVVLGNANLSYQTDELNGNENYNYGYNYSYEDEELQKGSNFSNYMPTVVSSQTTATSLNVHVRGQNEGYGPSVEGQKATYKDMVGRYLTYEIISYIGTGDVKGLKMPKGDISFDINLSQNGTIQTVGFENNWLRSYENASVGAIEPVVLAIPYGSSIPYNGNISLTNVDDSNYKVTIKDYGITFDSATNNAIGKELTGIKVINSYALTIFSPRKNATGDSENDGKNDITATMTLSNFSAKDTENMNMFNSNSSKTATAINKYYEVIDYTLKGEFYNSSDSKLSNHNGENGYGSVSKGETVKYKTTFNYKKTGSSQGLKEVIKVNTNAFRVVPVGDKDVNIKVETSSGKKLSADDFEVKFVTGNYTKENYSATNYDASILDSRLGSEDAGAIQTKCSVVNSKLSDPNNTEYNIDNYINLYGGPCIKANDGVETVYDRIYDAKEDEKEIPITKVIIQTKKGVILPDDAVVTVDIGIRVRNVSDLTQTYQITSMAMSSDYDKELTYYAPRVNMSDDAYSVASAYNYSRTIYNGSNVVSNDVAAVWGDSLRIVNFTSREIVTVTNKNKDGSLKNKFKSSDSEVINYNVKTVISDENMAVGADDVWYINHLIVRVTVPKWLEYIPDASLGKPTVEQDGENTVLTYTLPYTKPNQKIPEINFKAMVKPNAPSVGVEQTVESVVEAININGERDDSYFSDLRGSYTIYVSGVNNIILKQSYGDDKSVVEKDEEFVYSLYGYNNSPATVTDYSILDILPYDGDKNGSSFKGNYKVKVEVPSSLGNAKVLCSKQNPKEIIEEVDTKSNKFEECDITKDYVEATAIKVINITAVKDAYFDPIKVHIQPNGNKYSDKYFNEFFGANETYDQMKSNLLKVRVVSRSISGRVFIDQNENGIEDANDKYKENVSLTLYKLDSDNNLSEAGNAVTDKEGKYKFKDLESGRYKVRSAYDNKLYDLTLRYATEDFEHDSDAYKVEEGEKQTIVEITNRRIDQDFESEGILLTPYVEKAEDMNIGLINRKEFGFDLNKYITKIDLNTTAGLNTYNYENQSRVVLSVKNSLKATARVYYGINIENNSTKAGYIRLVDENIPEGMTFDPSDPYNSQWFSSDGSVRSIALQNDLINPGESRYLKIALDMPRQEQAKTFLNTVTLLEIEPYIPETLGDDTNADPNSFELGEEVNYAGVNWHVVNATPTDENGNQVLTLLANSIGEKAHTANKGDIYKWSTSLINNYINNEWLASNTINKAILQDANVCDDASGLQLSPDQANSYGGTLATYNFGGTLTTGLCQSGMYGTYKIRLLTEKEYIYAKNQTGDATWLNGNGSFWLMDSVWISQSHDSYGKIKENTNVKNLVKYVEGSTVKNGITSTDSNANWVYSNTNKQVRPVITISNKNIINQN